MTASPESSPAPPAAAAASRRAVAACAALIVAATVAAYANSFGGAFVFDDFDSIHGNPTIRSLWPIWNPLSPPAGGDAVANRPLVNLTLAINYALGDTDSTWSYHAVNLAVHVLAGLMLFGIVRRTLLLPALRARLGRSANRLALAAALLWTVHPLQTDAVTYIIQRTELLMGLFYLLTLYCVIRGASGRHRASWYAAAVAACLAGMGSKEAMATAPLTVLLYDRIFMSRSLRQILRRRWALYLGLAATWGLLAAVLIAAEGGRGGVAGFGKGMTAWQYARTQFGVVVHYLRLAFWPNPLVIDYGVQVAEGFWQIVPFAVAIAALLAATILALRFRPPLGFVGAWFFITLAPSSSVVPLVSQTAAEKRMYLPLAAVMVAVVLLAREGWRRLLARLAGRGADRRWLLGRVVPAAAVLAIAGAMACQTHRRNRDYASHFSIWRDAVRKRPGNIRARLNLGALLMREKLYGEAVALYYEALQRKSQVRLESQEFKIHSNLGRALVELGQLHAGMDHCREAIRVEGDKYEPHNTLGIASARLGDLDAAIRHYREAVRLAPDQWEPRRNLALALMKTDQVNEAIPHLQEAVRLEPDDYELRYNLGLALRAVGRFEPAASHFRQAVRLRPDDYEAHRRLALCLSETGAFEAAAQVLRDATALSPGDPGGHLELARVLARLGNDREAAVAYREALAADSRSVPALANLAWLLATSPDDAVRDGKEAVQLARRACRIARDNHQLLDTLAAAHAECGDFDQAVSTVQQAIRLARREGNEDAVRRYSERLELYHRRTPYHTPR
jgi:tetratricopeptide (TPR) repeat protein